ncbi:MAG: L-seryl-tRNA(Sec) selenium transferase [Dehalococcoidia bacterium]|nr:L-seryl-tRNA(Sec) selenium transferase [Dehalococcoidia bacterium]
MDNERLRQVPSVDAVLAAMREVSSDIPHPAALEAARRAVAELRESVVAGEAAPALEAVAQRAQELADRGRQPSLRRVINASGVILQTNLGRAPLSARAVAAMQEVALGYSNLEYDLEVGVRGSRHDHVRELLHKATGAEDGLVVNNNAAALFMVLQVFARGLEVVVSRGQAVEIGGGFRIPDVLRQSGAKLVEVGTTNRTYARDYAEVCSLETAAILRVHASNFKIVGFATEPSTGELAEVARAANVLLIDDLGSGCLVDTTRYGLVREPTVQESIAKGADLALFSGDKLLGGPQCGVIAGKAELVEELRQHPLARALRVDKLTIAALNATLASYVDGREAEEIPVWRMVGTDLEQIRVRAEAWVEAVGGRGRVVEATSMVGGGSLPGEGVRTWCAAIEVTDADRLAHLLRANDPPIAGRVQDGRLLMDPRTVEPGDDPIVAEGLVHGLSKLGEKAEN